MNKLKVAIDMDEVIVDLISHWEMIYRLKANIPITEDLTVKEWNIHKTFDKLPKNEIYDMLDIPGMFLHCKPISGAIDVIRSLENDERFDIHILTIAKAKTAYNEKLEWIEEHLGSALKYKTIGLSSFLFKAELACNYDVMIEDNHRTLANIKSDSGCHRILFKREHNSMASFPEDFDDAVDDWGSLLRKLLLLWETRYQKVS